MKDTRLTSLRRTLQQVKHHVEDAQGSEENSDDPRHVVDDLRKAQRLIDRVLKTYVAMARGAVGKPY